MILGLLASNLILLLFKCLTFGRRHVRFAQQKTAQSCGDAASTSVSNNFLRATPNNASTLVFPLATFVIAFGLGIHNRQANQRSGRVHLLIESGQKELHIVEALRALDLHPAPGSTILVRQSSLFPNPWHAMFIVALVWNDHSLNIYAEGANQLDERKTAKMNYIISLSEFEPKLEPRKV